jgi:hypothetical protein
MPAIISIDLITGFLSFLFTLLILSYVVGDNPGFRLAIHAFVGVSSGYIVVIVLQQVIVDKLILPMATGSILIQLLSLFPLVLTLLLLGKMSSRFEWMGRPVVALLVGVGTATAVTGAVLGTLFPQIGAATQLFDKNPVYGSIAGNVLTGVFALVGTIVTLAYFQFTVSGKNTSQGKRGKLLSFFALLGQVFIAITLGAIFAGVLAAALTALIDRMQSLVTFVEQLVTSFTH